MQKDETVDDLFDAVEEAGLKQARPDRVMLLQAKVQELREGTCDVPSFLYYLHTNDFTAAEAAAINSSLPREAQEEIEQLTRELLQRHERISTKEVREFLEEKLAREVG